MIKKLMAAAAVASLMTPASMAAVRPSVANNLGVAPAAAGARMGVTKAKGQNLVAGVSTPILIVGGAAAALGIAAAAGAFNGGHHNSDSVSP